MVRAKVSIAKSSGIEYANPTKIQKLFFRVQNSGSRRMPDDLATTGLSDYARTLKPRGRKCRRVRFQELDGVVTRYIHHPFSLRE